MFVGNSQRLTRPQSKWLTCIVFVAIRCNSVENLCAEMQVVGYQLFQELAEALHSRYW